MPNCFRKARTYRVCTQNGCLPLQVAAEFQASEAVVKQLLEGYPDAIQEKDTVHSLHPLRPMRFVR